MFEWIGAVPDPRKVFNFTPSLVQAFSNLLSASLLCALLFCVIDSLTGAVRVLTELFGLYPARNGVFSLLYFFASLSIAAIIIFVILFLAGQLVYFGFSRLLGGSGKFVHQLYYSSIVSGPAVVSGFLALWLILFSILLHSVLLLILGLVLLFVSAVYLIYSMYLVFNRVHSLSVWKFITVLLVPNVAAWLISKLFLGS